MGKNKYHISWSIIPLEERQTCTELMQFQRLFVNIWFIYIYIYVKQIITNKQANKQTKNLEDIHFIFLLESWQYCHHFVFARGVLHKRVDVPSAFTEYPCTLSCYPCTKSCLLYTSILLIILVMQILGWKKAKLQLSLAQISAGN